MTSSDMVVRVKNRTHQSDESRIIEELNGAQSWAFSRIYNSEGGPDLLVTIDEELTLNGNTREYSLTDNLTYDIVGLKQLWLQLPTESQFTLMKPMDLTDPQFTFRDTLSTTEVVISGQPVFYYVENFATVRFSGLLPTSSVIRVDYFRFPPDLDPTANDALTNGLDLPAPLHMAIVDYATSEIWDAMDDDRAIPRMQRAVARIDAALYVVQARTKGPSRTSPYKYQRRRWI